MKYIEEGFEVEKTENALGKPEILLIGDSIRLGYCETVRRELKEEYTVAYPEENCRSTQYILMSLSSWANLVDPERTVLVLLNAGHWDTAHWSGDELPLTSLEEYGKNIRLIEKRCRKLFPRAKIVYVNTSRMKGEEMGGVNPRDNRSIAEYNAMGRKVSEELGIETMNMFDYCRKYGPEDYADYAHLTPEAFEDLGLFVTAEIRRIMK